MIQPTEFHRMTTGCRRSTACALVIAWSAVSAAADIAGPLDPRRPPPTAIAGIDTPGDPTFTPSAADSPTDSSGPFDAARGDLGEDDDLAASRRRGRRRRAPSASTLPPDPLAGTPQIDPAVTGPDAETLLAGMLPPRDDSPADWQAGLEPLHRCGEPRALPPCVPPPPCHPTDPPRPYDLVGARGTASCGPIYGGPCAPRSGQERQGHLAWLHRIHDACFDRFYAPK